ncbi:hypothetical protein EO087_02865 [Dyella sp. M7H15-1]|uniref:hypothetical protein n=1 Tax=Dyella sp. M7H15-1 TaxID=2501295 RepID=UPI001004EFFB|nr:hypothetical protein [Dyella sp. M7H15-1]QAU23061.1 hypothetical protein EO087_02865 [Dyella sp. M7H15-1]
MRWEYSKLKVHADQVTHEFHQRPNKMKQLHSVNPYLNENKILDVSNDSPLLTNSEAQGLKALSEPKIFALNAHDIVNRDSVIEKCRSLTNHSKRTHRICEINTVKTDNGLRLEFNDNPSIMPISGILNTQTAFKNDIIATTNVVALTLSVLEQSGQLQYLNDNIDSFIKEGFYPVITVDYYGDRSTDVNTVGFHRDSTGSTLFVDLIYNTDHAIDGPEYIKHVGWNQKYFQTFVQPNMPTTALEHIAAESINPDGVDEEIKLCRIPANGVVGFTDTLIFHSTPQEASRAATKEELFNFLKTKEIDSNGSLISTPYVFKHACHIIDPNTFNGKELEDLQKYISEIPQKDMRDFHKLVDKCMPIAHLILNSQTGDKIYQTDLTDALIDGNFCVRDIIDFENALYYNGLHKNPLDRVALINCGNTCHSRLTSTTFPIDGKMKREKSIERMSDQGSNQSKRSSSVTYNNVASNNGAQPREFLRLWVQFKKSDPT